MIVTRPAAVRRAIFARLTGLLLCIAAPFGTPTASPEAAPEAAPATLETPRRLVAAIPRHFSPIFEVSGNQVPTGFGMEVMELIAAQVQAQIDYRVFPDWASVLAALRNGEVDLIPNLGITAQRREDFAFSDPTVSFTLRLFVRREDARHLKSLDEVLRRQGRVASIADNIGQELLQGRPDIDALTFNSLPDALVALRSKTVDALLFPAEVVWYLSRELGSDAGIVAVGEPLALIPRAIAVRKDRAELLALFNPAIRAVVQTPAYALAQERWFPSAPSWWTLRRTLILLAGLIFAATVAAFSMRNLGLRRTNKRLRQSLALNQAILDTAFEAILTTDDHDLIRSANPAAARMLCRPAAELVGRSICAVLAPNDQIQACTEAGFTRFYRQFDTPADEGQESIEMTAYRDGEAFPVRTRLARLRHHTPPLLMLTLEDLSALRRAEAQALYLTDHDPLTGLLNHQGALLVLENLLAGAARAERTVCCIMLGLHRLPQFNELYGRSAGDAHLSAIAQILATSVRQSDVVGHESDPLLARTGGDRFLIVLTGVDGQAGRPVSERIMSRLHTVCIDTPVGSARCEAHVGIACFPQHGTQAAELISHAEMALQAAREHGVHHIVEFTQDLQSSQHAEGRVVQMVFDALEHNRFVLYFQPVQNLHDGSVSHYEALVRIEAADGELIMPGTFIPTAERHGLIARIDYAVLRRAFSHLAGAKKGDDFTLAVNISAAHFGDRELLDWLKTVFAEDVVSPHHLVFEITETAALRNIAIAREFMAPLHALGCRFALDDFGVGFASFEYLRLLPVDFVKIDGSFIRTLPDSAEDRAIVRAITQVAHATGRKVVAEFVEGPQHLALITEMGVDYAQGYHIGRPSPEPPHTRPGIPSA
ncbi:MAG: EAL domain-containing protein [Gammaproteobacteria bacterium]